MKKTELTTLRGKDIKELIKSLKEKKAEAVKLVTNIYGGKEKNFKTTKKLRRDIAQILTVIKEKEILESQEKKEETK